MLVAVGNTLELPEVAYVPDHAPDAVHEVASVADQVSVLLLPASIELGFAANEMTGTATAGVTLMVVVCEAAPPSPLHESE